MFDTPIRNAISLNLREYGAEIRKKRKRAKLTQLDVAYLVGVSQCVISFIETGHYFPSKDLERALALVLDDEE